MIGIIINADDFGYSKIFNERILDLLRKWFLKSTTVMVDCVEAGQKDQVNDLIELEKRGDIGVWLHVVFDLTAPWYDQIDLQFRKFLDIFPFTPSHLDLHKHTTNIDCVDVVTQYGVSKNLPVRHLKIEPSTKHTTHPVFSSVPFNLPESIHFLETLKDWETCEILCHPWEFDPNCTSSFNAERIRDYEWIVKLHEYIAKNSNFQIISYKDI